LRVGDLVRFINGTPPSGLTLGTTYYVASQYGCNQFCLLPINPVRTLFGNTLTPINLTTTGSGASMQMVNATGSM
jgi:hypothetical protein